MKLKTGVTLAVAVLALAACNDVTSTGMTGPVPTGGNAAETACMRAVSANTNGSRPTVVGSDPSASAPLVMLRSGDGTDWRCVVAPSGVVQDLAVA